MKKGTGPLYLCLDQGGHASRALVFDGHGQLHAEAFREIVTTRDGPKVEHHPDEVVESLLTAASDAMAMLGATAKDIVAAGLATQRSSIVCWERQSGKALSPVLSWQDTRAASWLDKFNEHEARIHSVTGLMLSAHYGVSKLNWCLENLHEVRAAQARGDLVCGPLAAFLAGRLTNNQTSMADPANASRTLLWDRSTRDWSDELLKLFGIPRECLPTAVPSRHRWGDIRVAGRLIPLEVVTGDQSAALFAFGEPDPATLYANLGTGAFLQRTASATLADPERLLASIVYQDNNRSVQVIEGTVNGAGSALSAVATALGITEQQLHTESTAWLENFATDVLFINAIAGIGSPWWIATAESRFAGEDATNASPADKLAAVMESIVFLLMTNLSALNDIVGEPQRLLVTGGLGSVDPLLQRLANLAQLPVERAANTEATARGLACLLAETPAAWPAATIERVFNPLEDAGLLQRYKRWCELMPRYRGYSGAGH